MVKYVKKKRRRNICVILQLYIVSKQTWRVLAKTKKSVLSMEYSGKRCRTETSKRYVLTVAHIHLYSSLDSGALRRRAQ